jgi:hypothetical protein
VNPSRLLTDTKPSDDGKTWTRVRHKYPPGAPGQRLEVLCRKTLGFIDLPEITNGKVSSSRIDSNHLFVEHKLHDMVKTLPLDDGRRDLGEENGMTCSQCHIRNFGMHDYAEPANVDPTKGTPKAPNKALATLNFQIIPGATWEAFTLDFLRIRVPRQAHLEQFLGPDFAKRLTCPLAPK